MLLHHAVGHLISFTMYFCQIQPVSDTYHSHITSSLSCNILNIKIKNYCCSARLLLKGVLKLKCNKCMLASSCLSFRPSICRHGVLSSCWMDFCGTYCFIKICQKFKFGHNQTKLTDTLQNYLCKFLTSFVINITIMPLY